MDIVIVLPYENAEKETPLWAEEEAKIDFRREIYKGARCTSAFAAVELNKYLSRIFSKSSISFSSQRPDKCFFIELKVLDPASKCDVFSIEPFENGICVLGYGRTGLLYGAYEFLRIQGFRWYAPGEAGEIIPDCTDRLILPETKKEFRPSMDLARGFYFEGVLKESEEMWLWMARNNLNLATWRPATGPLGNKLGMIFRVGGHILEKMLDPNRIMPSGRTIWEEHVDWYGLPDNGKREKEKVFKTQFCVSQRDLLEFVGKELLYYLTGEWKEADQVDIWGFDTWGSTCNCEKCKNLGNGSDQMVSFLSTLRSIIDVAHLDHDVCLVMCSYEGTSTISGPLNPIPQNLIDAGDYVTFFPINRCYAHDIDNDQCQINKTYYNEFISWFGNMRFMPVMIGEYYNVSKFEDLPLLFITRIKNDIPMYYSAGARGMAYMHLPMVNWGMRTLTQLIFARLSWDIYTDVDALLNEYFFKWYGPYAEEMSKVYALVEESWLLITEWRVWDKRSILSILQAWDGSRPKKPLLFSDHFLPEGVVYKGRKSTALMQEAMGILNEVRKREMLHSSQKEAEGIHIVVNPLEASRLKNVSPYEMRLGEDRRLLIFGMDTMAIMTELVRYHDALYYNNCEEAEAAWGKIDEIADKLDAYFMPIGFKVPVAGLESKDALSRSQVRDVLRRIRIIRNNEIL